MFRAAWFVIGDAMAPLRRAHDRPPDPPFEAPPDTPHETPRPVRDPAVPEHPNPIREPPGNAPPVSAVRGL